MSNNRVWPYYASAMELLQSCCKPLVWDVFLLIESPIRVQSHNRIIVMMGMLIPGKSVNWKRPKKAYLMVGVNWKRPMKAYLMVGVNWKRPKKAYLMVGVNWKRPMKAYLMVGVLVDTRHVQSSHRLHLHPTTCEDRNHHVTWHRIFNNEIQGSLSILYYKVPSYL